MIVFMSKGQVTYIVNGVVMYCIRCQLHDHVYVKGASDIHYQWFSDIQHKMSIMSKGQLTHIVNGVVIYCIIHTLSMV